jgi:hypothetical protein
MCNDGRFVTGVTDGLRHCRHQVKTLDALNLEVNVRQRLAHDVRRISAASELLTAIGDQPVIPK